MAKATSVKSGAVSAIEFLALPKKHSCGPVCAVFGDEAFLKREVLKTIRRLVFGGDDGEFSLSTIEGDAAQLRDVLDALATVTLFGGERRLVIVEDADSFVSEHRSALEAYVERPAKGSVLLLEVKTWPGNTRLAKAVAAVGIAVECKSPTESQIKRWLIHRATTEYGARLESAAADALVQMLPPELGILEQELAKLSLVAGKQGVIDANIVRENVGGWRTRTTWDLVDAAADGRAADALGQLHRLIAAGEKPQGLLPQIGHTLRQLATATRLIETADASGGRLSLRSALEQAGVPAFKISMAERQLRQLGRERAKQLTGWLLAADLAMKGHNSADARARLELERLIVRLSTVASDRSQASPTMASG
jgi:DNA polymerase III subunit delta